MATIVPGLPNVGYYLGEGLGSGLRQLAHDKSVKLQEKNAVDRLLKAGFSSQAADFISKLPYDKQLDLIIGTGGFPDEPQYGGSSNTINSLLSNESAVPKDINRPNELASLLGSQKPQQADYVNPRKVAAAETQQVQPPETAMLSAQQPETPLQQNQKPTRSLAQLQRNSTPAETKALQAEQNKTDKETLPYYRELLKADEGAKGNDKRLNRMETLVKEGGLPVSSFYKLFKDLEEHVNPLHAAGAGGAIGGHVGGPIGAVAGAALGGVIQPVASLLRYVQRQTSPNTEEYEKLTADFIRDAKNVFGARITNADLSAFMQMIPTLSISDAGKLKIINNMKSFNDAVHIKSKAMKDIIKENGGKRPANLEILVDERTSVPLQELSERFSNGVSELQDAQNKIIQQQSDYLAQPEQPKQRRNIIAETYLAGHPKK